MSDNAGPKRLLGVEDDNGVHPKRARCDDPSIGHWDSIQALSLNTYETINSQIQNNATQGGDCSNRASAQHMQSSCRSPRFDGICLTVEIDILPPLFNVQKSSSTDDLVQSSDLRPESPHNPQEDICFGMLRDIQIRIEHIRDNRPIPPDEIAKEDVFASLELNIQKDRCDILVNGVRIATMNKKTHIVLKALTFVGSVTWTGQVPRSELCQKLAAAAKSSAIGPSKITCGMSILIFGPPSVAETLAKELGRYRLFLQHPQPMPMHAVYKNPQYLSIVAPSFNNGAILPPILTECSQLNTNTSDDLDQDKMINVHTVMDDLPNPDYLEEADIHGSIRTDLKGYQRKAVDFVICRETAQTGKQIKLWLPESSGPTKLVYQHIITGKRSPEALDMLGGILADGMGVGKTLIMIASIIAGLSRLTDISREELLSNRKVGNVPLATVSSTLVIVPTLKLVNGWIDEIHKHVSPGTLSYYVYHGHARTLPPTPPLPYHIVFSTYPTVASDFKRGGGVLNHFHWNRLILDEAHQIRTMNAKKFKAITSLSASIRWYDLCALIRFLRVPLLEDAKVFRKHISQTRKKGGLYKPNYRNLKLLLGAICLRRNTSSVLTSLCSTSVEHRPCLSGAERNAYDKLAIACSESIKAAASGPATKGGNKLILISIMRLQMFCNTGLAIPVNYRTEDLEEDLSFGTSVDSLQQYRDTTSSEYNSSASYSDSDDDHPSRKYRASCGQSWKWQGCAHGISDMDCVGDQPQELSNLTNSAEEDMMQDVQTASEYSSEIALNITRSNAYPSKLVHLLEDIERHYSEDKSIVFSVWRRTLDVVGNMFDENSVRFIRVDGGMDLSHRESALMEFQKNASVRVLLMTIGTGAIGLNNLCVASRVHILEPQWNPSVEDQAIGRALRLGQEKKVRVIRYITQKTVDEISKLKLSLNGGLHSSDQKISENERRTAYLRHIGNLIESTVLVRSIS
ncbi:SNF2 family N-terminal domain-containing protein [Aspergillus caelatus]|uniref:SNF2 family N-terminal domain-containing protein n=1 Tax=Aspergillus caelatus TaxID=61420 RepID=A0A5N6ZVD0_9EURO|nr:SNF2 family N-terminal domain-containing protein [Aspergillus caelatus]KAE8360896.1 SNF2 family N-terminal domain-containing protein [Aspergillus caelatus]